MRTIDLYELLSKDQIEQVAEIFMEALAIQEIYPEIWEMKMQAIITSETDF